MIILEHQSAVKGSRNVYARANSKEARHDASSISYEKKRSSPPDSDSLSTVTERRLRRAKDLKRSPRTTMLEASGRKPTTLREEGGLE